MERGQEPVDGRTARALRTREAIVVAVVALLEEGQVQPSVEEVAARAGVSERSVFGHFHDREGLFLAVREHQRVRLLEAWGELPAPDRPLAERIDGFVEQRARIYELMMPVRRAGLLMEASSETVRQGMTELRALKRHDAWRVFAAELGDDEPRRAALAALASFSGWEALRTQQDLSIEDAAEALRAGLSALLR